MVECGIEALRLGHALSADLTGRTDHVSQNKIIQYKTATVLNINSIKCRRPTDTD